LDECSDVPEHSHVDHWLFGKHGRELDPSIASACRGTTEPRASRTSLFRFEGVAARLSRRASVSLFYGSAVVHDRSPRRSGDFGAGLLAERPSVASGPSHLSLENCIASTSIK
jgi:hypothetical protein